MIGTTYSVICTDIYEMLVKYCEDSDYIEKMIKS
jgi:hypothetical protein